jgi:membrane protease YdiL (CAAX protease family)
MHTLIAVGLVAAVAGWNNALHLTPARWRDAVVSAGVAVAGVAGAVWLFSALDPHGGLAAAWIWTATAAGISVSVVTLAHHWKPLAKAVSDRRIGEMSNGAFIAHTILRIPLLTAFTEEILFRGVIWALLQAVGGWQLAWVGSSVAFALGHVVVAMQQARREGYPTVRWIITTLVMMMTAGVLLGWLRMQTGGVWASVGVHASVNAIFALGARSLAIRARRPRVAATAA